MHICLCTHTSAAGSRPSPFQPGLRFNLARQVKLEGGEWVDLLGPDHPGIAEVKWSANRFTPFLCIGPTSSKSQAVQDAEEFIEVQIALDSSLECHCLMLLYGALPQPTECRAHQDLRIAVAP